MPYRPSHQPIGLPFIELQTVDSTNNYALSRIHAGLAEHGMAVFSYEQTGGKGQRGKKWSSLKGENIALSIVVNPAPLVITQQFQLSASIAVAVQHFFQQYAGADSKIKWPNDLYWNDRKAGGVLIENIIRNPEQGVQGRKPDTGSWLWAVVGIGINVNQTSFPGDLPNPVSLKQITGKNFEPAELAKEICQSVNNQYQKLIEGNFEKIYSQYLSCLYKLNEKVKLKKGSRVFEARIKEVSPVGKLIVQHSIEEEFNFGEIEWVI